VHGFSTRRDRLDFGRPVAGGKESEASEDRRESPKRLLDTLGFAGELYRPSQVHGANVAVLAKDADAVELSGREADGVISNHASQLIGVVTADCVPVLLADGERKVVAAVHAGWRGIVAGVLQRAIGQMVVDLGCRADQMRAAVGPHIGRCCYEVGAEVVEEFSHYRAQLTQPSSRQEAAWMLDLGAAVNEVLMDAGLGSPNIESLERCTHCAEELFYSYRRDATAGRQIAVIGLRP
jgi:hypothetical protein